MPTTVNTTDFGTLGVNKNADLASSDSIEGLYRALTYFQLKILEHVRISKNADEAIERADYIIKQIGIVLPNMLKPSARARSRDADDAVVASDAVSTSVAALQSNAKCKEPKTWDPITETCV
jgi:hypothetical protein